MEPFDDSFPEILRKNGIHCHLATDHWHYWREGGATYHTRYTTCELVRGQCNDGWIADLHEPIDRATRRIGRANRQFLHNQNAMCDENGTTTTRTMANGLQFLHRNHDCDKWFLQIECFDPHEPFCAPERFRKLYGLDDTYFEWPEYGLHESWRNENRDRFRRHYAATISFVDYQVGLLIDTMDRHNLWKDTMVIMMADHGFLLGEDDWYGKLQMCWRPELASTPCIVWDPRCGISGERRDALIQPTVDLAPTLLRAFGLEPTNDMRGRDLAPTINFNQSVRNYALFGHHGHMVNCTDGNIVLMHAPVSRENTPLFEYTLMPTHIDRFFSPNELAQSKLHPGFTFTKGCPVLRVPSQGYFVQKYVDEVWDSCRIDIESETRSSLVGDKKEDVLYRAMVQIMPDQEAPDEQYIRLGLT
jgi:hypothetical protein